MTGGEADTAARPAADPAAHPAADTAAHPAAETARRLLATMWRIRAFDERCEVLVSSGALERPAIPRGGHEAVAAGVCDQLHPDEPLFAGERPHGLALARGVPMEQLLAVLAGRCDDPGWAGPALGAVGGLSGTTGPHGEGLPAAVGAALAERLTGRCRPVVALFGPEVIGSGLFSEAVALAGWWRLPMLLVCENDRFAWAPPDAPAGRRSARVADLVAPHEVATASVDGNDVAAVHEAAHGALLAARGGDGPFLLECLTRRHGPGDLLPSPDGAPGGRPMLAGAAGAGDPLARLERQAAAAGWFGQDEVAASAAAARAEAAAAGVPR